MQGKDWMRTGGIVQNEGKVKTAEWKEIQPRCKIQTCSKIHLLLDDVSSSLGIVR